MAFFKKSALIFAWASFVCLPSFTNAIELDDEPKLLTIANELVAEGHYTMGELRSIFAKAEFQQGVLDAMQKPAEYTLTWGRYRKIFLKADRIEQGVEFWQEHQAVFDRAEQEFGVPASMIAAIIGVESKFGRYKGSHKVLDSLVTLTTGFPRRSKFFGSELKEFLILSKRNQIDPLTTLGSYAGAMGFPQFISSSYRNYAVDFSGDGRTDLINQPVDAIGSIANYFIENGWKPGELVTTDASASVTPALNEIANRKRHTPFTAAELRAKGARLDEQIADSQALNILMMDASDRRKSKNRSGTYIVRAGDTACEIAESHKVSCRSLIDLNKLNAKADIFRGQRLKLPAGGERAASDLADDQAQVIENYFYTFPNFYAITRYNQSVLYAMAVYELSLAIAKAKEMSTPITQ